VSETTPLTTTTPLGTSGMEITRIGYGAWAIGGGDWEFAWGAQDDAESVAAIRYAIDNGVNWIDTASAYGLGHSEEVVGRALAGLPEGDRPLVFTKGGMEWDENDRSAPVLHSVKHLRRSAEASLRRLGVERMDLFQIHWPPDDGTPLEEYWQTMVDLRDEGKTRAIGLSNHDVAQLEAAEAIGHVDALQPPFSAIHRAAADEIAWCAEHDVGAIVYAPMQNGLLTGAFSAERVASLPQDDWRKRSADFTSGLAANLQVAEALAAVGARHGTTPAAIAIAWTLAWRGVTGAIVGARRPDQIDGFVAGGELQLDDADLDEVAAAIERSGAGEGPARPG
jgi:aryl-alcohol dehydrogenase-like predicted oxidoreductase